MRKSLGIVSILALFAACGGPDSVSVDDLADELIDAFCDRAVRCGAYVDEASCKAGLPLDFESIKHSVEAGRINYDGEAVAECLDAFRDASCDSFSESSRNEPDACGDAISGAVPDGGTCFESDECVSGRCTEAPNCTMACCTGTCDAAVAVPAIGQPCPNFECGDDAFCSEAGTCTALLAAGGACGSSSECGYGLYCTEAGACTDAPNRGQACPDGTCADLGDRCDQTTTTCVALSGRGGPCREGFIGFLDCQQPLACDPSALTCVDPPTVGQACQFFCASGAFCNDAQTCEATRANGGACEGDDECSSRYCDDFAASPVCAENPVCG